MNPIKTLGLLFDPEPPTDPTPGQRLAAAFLRAYLDHGAAGEVAALTRHSKGLEAFRVLVTGHAWTKVKKRAWKAIGRPAFDRGFAALAGPVVLTCPELPDPAFAWARERPAAPEYILSGTAPDLTTAVAVERLPALITAPFQETDAVVCPSEAARKAVRAATGAYADYLRDRFGGTSALRPRIEVIPPGVDPEAEQPGKPPERAAARHKFAIADDEVVALLHGPLAFQTGANPYPVFTALHHAARAANRRVHLILAGRAPNAEAKTTVLDAARVCCPTVRVSYADPSVAANTAAVWHAADFFVTAGDSVRETFDLDLLRAMSRGLAVVAADWAAAREVVADGTTGLLVPTRAVPDATADLAVRLLTGGVDRDDFLAHAGQSVAVDLTAMGAAAERVLRDDRLRAGLGAAGRRRVLDHFTWQKSIAAHDALWAELAAARKPRSAADAPTVSACFPPPAVTFAGHATAALQPTDRLRAADDAETRLHRLTSLALTSYAAKTRSTDVAVLRSVLDAAAQPVAVADIDSVLRQAGVGRQTARATLAWMLKYGLLTPAT